jgi:hypothetical protein
VAKKSTRKLEKKYCDKKVDSETWKKIIGAKKLTWKFEKENIATKKSTWELENKILRQRSLPNKPSPHFVKGYRGLSRADLSGCRLWRIFFFRRQKALSFYQYLRSLN